MEISVSSCPCANTVTSETLGFRDFEALRQQCDVLREIYIPDSVWQDYRRTEDDDPASHQHILFLALSRGYLGRLTSPVHRYLLGSKMRAGNLTNQYRMDLRERWMLERDILERHRKARIFIGKVAELLCAEWLETRGWVVDNLEAFGSDFDIEAISPDKRRSTIEVKYVGEQDEVFLNVVDSLSGNPSTTLLSPYGAMNFFLFKVYSAAKQLTDSRCRRIVFLVISPHTWSLYRSPVKNRWINWQAPSFLPADDKWHKFLDNQSRCYPDISSDLRSTVQSLDEIWLIKIADDFQLTTHEIVKL